MHSNIESIFDEAENRYLKSEELNLISQYVDSLPERLEMYRTLRDQELNIMQRIADQLQVEMPQEKVENLERSIKNAILVVRYCAMGVLLNDDAFVKERLLGWLNPTMQAYNTRTVDIALHRLLNRQLNQVLGARQMSFLAPMLAMAQESLLQPPAASATTNGR